MSSQNNLPNILPKPSWLENHEGFAQAAATSSSESSSSKRKREVVSVACYNCRKRKAKCGGQRPTCHGCEQANLNCEYSLPEGTTSLKAAQKKIEDFERSNLKFQHLFELLRFGSEAASAEILKKIRSANNLEGVIGDLAVAQTLLSISAKNDKLDSSIASSSKGFSNLGSSSSGRRFITSPFEDANFVFEKGFLYSARHEQLEKDVFVDLPTHNLDISRWTTVSEDNRLMNHLLSLFWTWDNVVERSLYQPIFEQDLVSKDPHSDDAHGYSFCSPFLVNALLALSCLYTLEPATFAIPEDPKSRGRRFAEEAERLLEKEMDKPSFSLLQGVYALFAYEGNLGKGSKSVEYFLRTMDTFKLLNNTDFLRSQNCAQNEARLQKEREAVSWILWGLYVVEWKSSQAMGFRKLVEKPIVGKLWREKHFSMSNSDCVGFWWCPYPMSLQTQKSMRVEVREADVALAELAEEALSILVPDKDAPMPTDPQRALQMYDAVLNWKFSLPDRLKFEDAVLPSTILLHAAAEIMLIALLHPFCHLKKEDFGTFDPKERSYTHATSMMNVIWTFRAFAMIRHEYWLVHCLSTSAFVVLRDLDHGPGQMDTLIRACHCLHEMTPILPLAIDCLMAISAGFKRSKLQIPDYVMKYFGLEQYQRKDGLMHHAFAALMPASNISDSTVSAVRDLSFQELLDSLDDDGLD